jgi:molybdenum cofactor cytidylyltransferase
MEHNLGIIILAAGSSSRLGQPKQLLEYNSTTLLENAIAQASGIPYAAIVVVTGSNSEAIEADLSERTVTICYNKNWEQGMGSSIATGLKRLLELHPDLKACIFAVCDQPFVTTQVFQDILEQQIRSGKGIVASLYAETLGTPVLFSHVYFEALLNLNGKEGAKKIVELNLDDVASVPFDKGAIDIDTIHDYNNLISSK